MRAFNRVFAAVIAVIGVLFAAANLLINEPETSADRMYIVEISRLCRVIEEKGFDAVDLGGMECVVGVVKQGSGDLFASDCDYAVREIGGELYRFDYVRSAGKSNIRTVVNVMLGCMAAVIVGVLVYVRVKILKPFDRLKELPYELSKGNLTAPVKENKSRFFGRFLWGVDMLRENMEQQKKRELDLLREKKTMLLSLSHDIKTPLSAIKLYSGALSKGLYSDSEKQREIAENINAKADEIEGYVSQIIRTSRDDLMEFEVEDGEFYLSQLVNELVGYYAEKTALAKTEFIVGDYSDCMISGDLSRGVEVMQNIMENALKYGDGGFIDVGFGEEEGCLLVTVRNGGCTLSDDEMPHIFDSFWRGSNAGNSGGSGLGLYICRRLMNAMGGEVFAELDGGVIAVTAVFVKV